MDGGDGEDDPGTEAITAGFSTAVPSPRTPPHLSRMAQSNQTTWQSHDNEETQAANLSSPISGAFSPEGQLFQHHSRVQSGASVVHLTGQDDYPDTVETMAPLFHRFESTPTESVVSLTSEELTHDTHSRPFTVPRTGQTFDSTHPPSQPNQSLRPIAFALYLDVANSTRTTAKSENSLPLSCADVNDKQPQHALVPSVDLEMDRFRSISLHELAPEKYPGLFDLCQQTVCTVLFARVGLNLDLTLKGSFKNVFLLQSTDRQTVCCKTSIYSFGTKVLESTEMKQAAAVDDRFVYSFQFVNQFFSAFLGGIQKLGASDEVDMALNNLSIVQVYEDLETGGAVAPPLLVIAFEFERGSGGMDTFLVTDGC